MTSKKLLRRLKSLKIVNIFEGSKSQYPINYLSSTDLNFLCDLEKVDEKNAEFENSAHLNEGSKPQVSFSAKSIFLRGDLEEVVQKNAEFENSYHLKKRS